MTFLKHFGLISILISGASFSQVGINTPNPQNTFHVDGGKNNSQTGTPTEMQKKDDFIITSTGNVGLGIISPSVKLDIVTLGTSTNPIPGIKLNDGSQGEGKVLTSDDNGIAIWKKQSLELITGNMGNGYDLPFFFDLNYHQTGSSITLPSGKWLVTVNLLAVNNTNSVLDVDDYIWFRSTFSDSQINPTKSADIEGTADKISGMLQGPVSTGALKYNVANGQVVINNQTGTTKTYWLIVGNCEVIGAPNQSVYLDRLGGSNWGENIISAVPIQ